MTKHKQTTSQTPAKSVVPKARKKKATPTLAAPAYFDSDKENLTDADETENHHLTDQLLTLIEDSELWKAVFGFDKGTSGSAMATGKGKNTLKHCADIAIALFINYVAGMQWTFDDIKVLQGVVKNRIGSLRSSYADICTLLGETGHGLIVSGRENELIDGSPAANVYDVIKNKFPWYCRMHQLMGLSPVVSRKAVSNSKSVINLGVLDHNSQDTLEDEFEHTPSIFDDDDDPLRSPLASWPSNIPATPIKYMITLPSKHRAQDTPTHTKSASKKHKSVHDMAREVADAERDAHLLMNETNAKERTAREEIKCRSAFDTALAVERM
ncbi:hypothetical protein EDB19DRAFT_1906795 [Suillus lakei]|nr:hypothetical protein EDB19DRAFT_1906795 [Suillus lakei]